MTEKASYAFEITLISGAIEILDYRVGIIAQNSKNNWILRIPHKLIFHLKSL